jgi:DUF1680 family protein
MSTVKVTDQFWQSYRQLVRQRMIPYQWGVINDQIKVKIETENDNTPLAATEYSHAMQNLKIAAGQASGDFYGFWFQDSDVYKWLEAAAYSLAEQFDADLKAKADSVITLIAEAQEPDGYLDTYFQIRAPQRKFQHVSESHELYCMGHYIEAGIAYYQAVGNTQALEIAIKMADCIDAHFGPEANKLHGYPGHPELELALAKLADVTKEPRYSQLAKYMLDQRGTQPNFFASQAAAANGDSYWPGGEPAAAYLQNRVPVRALEHAEGHAVRMVYLLTGMVHVARQTHDDTLLAAAKHLWTDITQKQMYITGGVGATVQGEAFTFDYDLPNDTMYCETCASCAMAFLARQLLLTEPKGEYGDILEKELYNGTISGMALDGEHFFYVNPLQVNPESSAKDPTKSHVKVTRPAWFGCACCPPNLARLIASVDQYIYTQQADTIYNHLFISSSTQFDNGLTITIDGNYPWSGDIKYRFAAETPVTTTLAIRIPAWAKHPHATIDGKPATITVENGFWFINQAFSDTTRIDLSLDMMPQRIHADPHVFADIGHVAIMRGPVVYCLEQADNGSHLPWLSLPETTTLRPQVDTETFAIPLTTIQTVGRKLAIPSTELYATADETRQLTFIPYFAWANRTPGEMQVWIRETQC